MKNKVLLFLVLICIFFMYSCGNSGRRHKREKAQTAISGRKARQVTANSNVEMSSNTKQMSGSEIFQKYNSAVFMVYTSDGYNAFQGSGFFISPNGIAVSNYHVFKGTGIGLETIKLSSGEGLNIEKVIAKSDEEDFIIFQVQMKSNRRFAYIPIASRSSSVGEKVYAIGSPRGLENTFSSGEISQKRDNNIIQISVPIDHGSSGGALINSYGEVIGITSGGRDDSGANLNFAIEIKVIRRVLGK